MFKFLRKADANKNKKELNQDNVCKENLREAINEVILGNAHHIDEDYLGCSDTAKIWNNMIDRICSDKKDSLIKINSMLGYITEMNYVKDMIDDVKLQTDSLRTMAANSQEMSASIDDVSNRTQNASLSIDETMRISQKGNADISQAFTFVQKSFTDIQEVSINMNNLTQNMKQIEEIIDIIKGIADQTNLLALNAAIEAARAGEQGRGFAVVAGEVRKLAEHTKTSVMSIQQNISHLETEINLAVTKTNATAKGLETGKSLVDNALQSIQAITTSVGMVNDEILQIASNTEEQTAVTEEFTSKTMEISSSADTLMEKCDETGRGIFKLSQINNELRLNLVKNDLCLDMGDMLDICKVDHLMWRWRVYNMILGYEKIDINAIGDHTECRLGKWYYGDGGKVFKNNKTFMAMENPHIDLHKLAKEATIAYNHNDIAGAEQILVQMDECSKKVLSDLYELKQQYKNMEVRG